MAPSLLMLPPQSTETRDWGARVADALPRLHVVVAEDEAEAARVVGTAEAAFGVMPPVLLRQATRLRWLQAPRAAPPAGYYYPELIAHPVIVTNFREIYNDHIAAHIMAFVLASARGLHHYLPRQWRRQWRPEPLDTGVVHLPEARSPAPRWTCSRRSRYGGARPVSRRAALRDPARQLPALPHRRAAPQRGRQGRLVLSGRAGKDVGLGAIGPVWR